MVPGYWLAGTNRFSGGVSVVGMKSCLVTQDVSIRYSGVCALDEVSLELRQGEILGLLGPNGAGKTTLVNVLSGFTPPTRGEVLVDGNTLTGSRVSAFVRRGIARTFQSVRLFRRLTVMENVMIPAIERGDHKHRDAENVQHALGFVGIQHLGDKVAGTLPYTEERLVGISRALAARPRFLLLDEPAAGMNDAEGAKLADLIKRIPPAFGCGVLLIEHNMPVAMAVCERLHVLQGGRTLAVGPREEVRQNREVIQSYLGSE